MYIKILTTHKPKISTTYLASCYIHNNVTTYLASCYIHNKYQSHTFFSVLVIYITMSRSYQRNRCYVHINFDHKFTPNTNHIPFFCTSYIHNNVMNISKKTDVMYISILITNSHQIPITYLFAVLVIYITMS